MQCEAEAQGVLPPEGEGYERYLRACTKMMKIGINDYTRPQARKCIADAPTIDWIRGAAGQAEIVTSVCTGALLLASAGLLAGKRATTHWAALDLLAQVDPTVRVQRDTRVVRAAHQARNCRGSGTIVYGEKWCSMLHSESKPSGDPSDGGNPAPDAASPPCSARALLLPSARARSSVGRARDS